MIKNILKKINPIEYFLSKINEIHYDTFNRQYLEQINIELAKFYHSKAFKDYKNYNLGKDVVLVASGPSVKDLDYSIFPQNAVYVGVNKSFLIENILLDFLFVNDWHKDQDIIDNYKGNDCKKFYSLLPYRHLYNPNLHTIPEINLLNANASRFVLDEVVNRKIAYNIEVEPIGDFQSTTFSALQFIFYTNPKKIYLVGCDCSNNGHFYSDPCRDILCNTLIGNWKRFKHFADIYYPNIEIISVNPVGLKGLFSDLYT